MSELKNKSRTSLTIIGGGPGGYEAALVAARLGAQVTVVERAGIGGSAVLTDVVPSKSLIATSDAMRRLRQSPSMGVRFGTGEHNDVRDPDASVDLAAVNKRLLRLAHSQSTDIRRLLQASGIRVIKGTGKLTAERDVELVELAENPEEGNRELPETPIKVGDVLPSDAVLIAVGAHPRELPTAKPDGERIFNWTQLYEMEELPEHLIVIGSGVTGAEFASAYNLLGSHVTLISSRDRVLPGEDSDAAEVLEDVFVRQGIEVLARSRAESVERIDDGVLVTLSDGSQVRGSHCLVAVGSIPNTADLGLEEAGVAVSESGHIQVDGVSRTSATNVYAAGDCTGVFQLASVSAMQGRTAVAHLLGDGVKPFRPYQVSSNIFTAPEIATVGITQAMVDAGDYQADVVKLDFATNARAKMLNVQDGFVKIFSRTGSGTVLGAVVVAPRASELIYPLAIAVTQKLHVDAVAETYTVYPSLSGSIGEAARRLHMNSLML
ncbi:NAD(P)H-quinone dehydrogenase [Micrococcoides hystricis]|uniref:NAD(P)H-quinone dehydrogenase n=1 Tax=Micrococcoides hystricis TaxID=1572761 RepID=A0ABV6PCH6_9MICC